MRLQVVASTRQRNGALEQALMLARAAVRIGLETRLASLSPAAHSSVAPLAAREGVGLEWAAPDRLPGADLHVVVGLGDPASAAAAACLSRRNEPLFLAPALYTLDEAVARMARRADRLLFVSWDQAAHLRPYWCLAGGIEVFRCAVDTDRFRPPAQVPAAPPWVLCRHSWDVPAKFAPNLTRILDLLGADHEVAFAMLGARDVLGDHPDPRIRALPQDGIEPVELLQTGHLWVYSHSPAWRETACIAMLEAMACGLPVLVSGAGGMREYLVHGQTGFACGDSAEFAEMARLLLDRPELRAAMGRAARLHVELHHSPASVEAQLRALLETLPG